MQRDKNDRLIVFSEFGTNKKISMRLFGELSDKSRTRVTDMGGHAAITDGLGVTYEVTDTATQAITKIYVEVPIK